MEFFSTCSGGEDGGEGGRFGSGDEGVAGHVRACPLLRLLVLGYVVEETLHAVQLQNLLSCLGKGGSKME